MQPLLTFSFYPKRLIIFLVLYSAGIFAAYAQTDPVTNQTVIALYKAGIGKEIITAKISTSACSFDLSTDGLIALKKDGVPDDIIAIMITKGGNAISTGSANPELALDPGMYYYNPIQKNTANLIRRS